MSVGGLTTDQWLVLAILLFTIFLSLSSVIRSDVLAVLVLVTLGFTKILPSEQLFSGFSSEAVISLIAIMIIGMGLEKSEATVRVARGILRFSREHPNKIVTFLMLTSGILASFLRSTGVVALFLPIVTRIHARTGISKSRLLMPLAFCSILGGSLTMVGSGSLIVLNTLLKNTHSFSSQALQNTLTPFQLFEVLPIGLMLLTMGIVYLSVMGPRFFPQLMSKTFNNGTTKSHFIKTYGIEGDIFELRVLPNSPFVNQSLQFLEEALGSHLMVLAIQQGKECHFPPLRKTLIQPYAAIAVMGNREKVVEFSETQGCKFFSQLNVFSETLHPLRSGLCEAVVPPSSQFIGQELRELHMRRNYRVQVIAVYRGNTVYRGPDLKSLVLRSGDTLGMFSRWEALTGFHQHPDFAVLTTAYPREETRPKKMPQALFFFLFSIALVLWGNFSMSVGFLVGAMGMIATGVLTIDEAYASVSWKTVFLLAGLMPLGLAMQTTGTADWLSQHTLLIKEGLPLWILQGGLALLTTALSLVISSVGATILLVPVALQLAFKVGADPRVFALIVALSASNTFLMPIQQVNALIAGPGNYKTSDFLKVGGVMTVLYWLVMLAALNWWF